MRIETYKHNGISKVKPYTGCNKASKDNPANYQAIKTSVELLFPCGNTRAIYLN